MRIGKIYNQMSTIQANNKLRDQSNLRWLANDAMKALPAALRVAAKIIDPNAPSLDRPPPLWLTPPVKNFNHFEHQGKEEGGSVLSAQHRKVARGGRKKAAEAAASALKKK